VPDAAALGAAICAAVGVGLHPDWDTATEQMVAPGPTFTPEPSRAAAYHSVRRAHARLAGLADTMFTDG
jgi:ribulose kinase